MVTPRLKVSNHTREHSSHISRRTVAKGALWAAPAAVVTTAAPAFAASPCDIQGFTVDFSEANYTWGDTENAAGIARATGGGDDFTYTVTSTRTSTSAVTLRADNLQRQPASDIAAGIPGFLLRLFQDTLAGEGQVVTFNFSRQVENLTFTLADVDPTSRNPGTSGFIDQVSLDPVPATVAFANPNYLQGDGSPSAPIRPRNDVNTSPSTSTNGNATVTIPGPVQSVSIRYTNGRSGDGWRPSQTQQAIGVSFMSFEAAGCDR